MAVNGISLAFITYTMAHSIDDTLVAVRNRVQSAHLALHSGKRWKQIEKEFGWGGSIKCVDITYTENGWHFHLHEIGFIEEGAAIDALESRIGARWSECLKSAGGAQLPGIGLVVKKADRAVKDYVGKWGIVPELASGQDKTAARGGVLPLQFPDTLLQGRRVGYNAQERFLEYSKAIKGVKQVWASPSVRPYMKEPKITTEPGDRIQGELATLTIEQWQQICHLGQRAKVLRAAESGNLTNFLLSININISV